MRSQLLLASAVTGLMAGAAPAMAQSSVTDQASPAAPATTATAAAPAAPAAQPTDAAHENILNQIVVTGVRRRQESVQSTPVAVTAFNPVLLQANQISNVVDFGRIAPNVTVIPGGLVTNQPNFFIRGFGTYLNDPAIDPPIALYLDGIYQPQAAGTVFDLFDADDVEIERGPQGTLLGKNAPTGAVSIVTHKPTGTFGGKAEVDYERFDHKEFKGQLDFPIIRDVLAATVSGYYKDGGDYIRDLNTDKRNAGGERAYGGHLGLLFTPSSNFNWQVSFVANATDNHPNAVRDISYLGRDGPYQGDADPCVVFGHCTDTGYGTTAGGVTRRSPTQNYQVASTINWHFEPVTLTSVTGFRHYHELNFQDVDGEPESIIDALGDLENFHQWSQEIRLSSQKGGGLDLNGHLDWVLGGYYSSFGYVNTQHLDIFGTTLSSIQHGTTDSYAVFGHAVYNITDKWNFSVGGRESWDHKTHNYISVGETTQYFDKPISFNNFSWEAGSQYKFSRDKMAYFRFAEGYRAGGFQGLPSPGGTGVPYNPEKVKTYEIGAKADWFDHHLRTNISGFISDYKGLQRSVVQSLPFAPFFTQSIENAANARIKGVEFETTVVPAEGLTISGSVTYLDTKYKHFIGAIVPGEPTDNSDFPFPFASKWGFKASPQYSFDLPKDLGTTTFMASVNHTTPYYTNEIPFPAARVRTLTLLDLSVRFEDPSHKYTLTVYGHNVTNQRYLLAVSTPPTAVGSAALYFYGKDNKPAIWGLSLGAKF